MPSIIEPPNITIEGILILAIDITIAAREISHPAKPMSASNLCDSAVSSIVSAIISLLISEDLAVLLDNNISSDKAVAVNSRGVLLLSLMARFASCACCARPIWFGDNSLQLVTTPINGCSISVVLNPIA